MNAELVHNITYAHRLPPTFIEQARGWANFRENAVFSDEAMGGIGNSCVSPLVSYFLTVTLTACVVASRTVLDSVINALQRIAFNGDPLQFMLIATTYQPFISLFHQTEMVKRNPELAAIREYLSSSSRFILTLGGVKPIMALPSPSSFAVLPHPTLVSS